jgi:hypothetical protein
MFNDYGRGNESLFLLHHHLLQKIMVVITNMVTCSAKFKYFPYRKIFTFAADVCFETHKWFPNQIHKVYKQDLIISLYDFIIPNVNTDKYQNGM